MTRQRIRYSLEQLKQVLEPNRGKPDVILYLWNIDDGTGEPGFCKFNTKTPVSEEEFKRKFRE